MRTEPGLHAADHRPPAIRFQALFLERHGIVPAAGQGHVELAVVPGAFERAARQSHRHRTRSEEHTSELQSLMRNSYAVFCLKKKNKDSKNTHRAPQT